MNPARPQLEDFSLLKTILNEKTGGGKVPFPGGKFIFIGSRRESKIAAGFATLLKSTAGIGRGGQVSHVTVVAGIARGRGGVKTRQDEFVPADTSN